MDEPDDEDTMRPEYDFRTMRVVGRGVYLDRYRAGTNLALLDPEVRKAFPTDEVVNEALRSLMQSK